MILIKKKKVNLERKMEREKGIKLMEINLKDFLRIKILRGKK